MGVSLEAASTVLLVVLVALATAVVKITSRQAVAVVILVQ